METIQVRYGPHALTDYAPGYHKYIVYSSSDGNEFYARGGPGNIGPGANDGGDPSPSFFGPIQTEFGEYRPGTPDWDPDFDNPFEVVLQGDDLSNEWHKIENAMREIDIEEWPYHVIKRNSNSAVDEALRRSGVPLPKGDYWAPGSGDWEPRASALE